MNVGTPISREGNGPGSQDQIGPGCWCVSLKGHPPDPDTVPDIFPTPSAASEPSRTGVTVPDTFLSPYRTTAGVKLGWRVV